MPDLPLTDVCREVCAAWGIRPAQVHEALRRPDQVELVQEVTSTETLLVRIVASRTAPVPESAWLVAVESLSPSPQSVDFAIRAFANDDPDFDSLSPVQMLRRVVEICDAKLVIAGIPAPFVMRQRVPIVGPETSLFKIVDERPDQYRGMLRLYPEVGGTSLVIVLGFGVGINRYKEYLRGNLR